MDDHLRVDISFRHTLALGCASSLDSPPPSPPSLLRLGLQARSTPDTRSALDQADCSWREGCGRHEASDQCSCWWLESCESCELRVASCELRVASCEY